MRYSIVYSLTRLANTSRPSRHSQKWECDGRQGNMTILLLWSIWLIKNRGLKTSHRLLQYISSNRHPEAALPGGGVRQPGKALLFSSSFKNLGIGVTYQKPSFHKTFPNLVMPVTKTSVTHSLWGLVQILMWWSACHKTPVIHGLWGIVQILMICLHLGKGWC